MQVTWFPIHSLPENFHSELHAQPNTISLGLCQSHFYHVWGRFHYEHTINNFSVQHLIQHGEIIPWMLIICIQKQIINLAFILFLFSLWF